MANDQRCQMWGKVFSVQGRHCPHPVACSPAPPGTWRPTVQWGRQGDGAGQRSRVRGQGHGVCGAATAAIEPGGKRQHHRRLDTRSHGPGPALVGGMAWQLPAPRGRDKGCHCWPATTAHHCTHGQGGHLARPRHGARGRMVQRPSRGVFLFFFKRYK
jgi:hypothetical protein